MTTEVSNTLAAQGQEFASFVSFGRLRLFRIPLKVLDTIALYRSGPLSMPKRIPIYPNTALRPIGKYEPIIGTLSKATPIKLAIMSPNNNPIVPATSC